jgi:hypothetical protein
VYVTSDSAGVYTLPEFTLLDGGGNTNPFCSISYYVEITDPHGTGYNLTTSNGAETAVYFGTDVAKFCNSSRELTV